ncbi:leukocyte immunoglobulin-like receptor subfamily A member 2 isoform X2 [Pelodiscus sinensis]|uniref:leukocyte immunoglobulin-like receptor subfamily A member 2 isoform X2 n=1 Tax=Pelodiscus sinensis TaxID=13735 RepID=UPI003F6B8086
MRGPSLLIMASALSILFLEPRVSISASPGEVIAPGGALTIRCCCRFGGRLFLYKDGAEFRELYPAGDGGEFTIRSARQEDAGSYSCESRAGWWLFQWAYDSDTLHISVAETYYPKPSISLRPSRRVALGGAVNIWCWGGPQNMRFLLSKEGTLHALQEVEPARDVAGFPIRNVSRQDAGSYRCYYRTLWDPAVRSRPSDPVELVVAEGTDPAGPQQPDPPTTAPQGEGEREKWSNSPPGTGLPLRRPRGHSGLWGGPVPAQNRRAQLFCLWGRTDPGDARPWGSGDVGPRERRAVARREHVWGGTDRRTQTVSA